ncbi:MAG: peptidoglycan-binding protein, partial [Acutalibacteraceae bacterium]
DMGLLCDGEVGPYTWAALDSYEAPTEKATEAPTDKKTEPTQAPTYEEVTDSANNLGDATVATDPATEAVTDAPTEKETEAPTEKKTEAPTPAPTEPPKVDKLALGGEGTKVSQLQSRLAELRYYFGDIDGVFDQDTYDAMQAYFKASELKPVDEMTDEQFALVLSDAAVKSPDYTNLQLGYTGTDVTALQKLLIEAGFMNGEASGIFDEKTQDAVKLAQTNFALDVDGVADAEFIKALEAQIKAAEETEPETEEPTAAPTEDATQAPTSTEDGETTKATSVTTATKPEAKTTAVTSTTTQGKGTANTGSTSTFIWVAAILFFISTLSLAVFATQGNRKNEIGRYYRK